MQSTSSPSEVVARAERRAAALSASGKWSTEDDAGLEEAFEQAAVAALAVPSLAERAPRARAVARVIVPKGLRPHLGRLARHVDAVIRRLVR